MGDVVNLNRFRKQAKRKQDKAKAEENRLTFGRSKVEKLLTAKEKSRVETHLDGHKLGPED